MDVSCFPAAAAPPPDTPPTSPPPNSASETAWVRRREREGACRCTPQAALHYTTLVTTLTIQCASRPLMLKIRCLASFLVKLVVNGVICIFSISIVFHDFVNLKNRFSMSTSFPGEKDTHLCPMPIARHQHNDISCAPVPLPYRFTHAFTPLKIRTPIRSSRLHPWLCVILPLCMRF